MGDYRLSAFKEFIGALLKDKRCLFIEDNVFYCDKLFIINSVVNQIYEMMTDDEVGINEMRTYLKYINLFIEDEIDITWEDGQFMFEDKE